MRSFLSRLIVVLTYLFSRIFFRFEQSWVQAPEAEAWSDIRVFAFMNHTSLLEPLFFGAFPFSFLWSAAPKTTMPGADITINRPIIGRFYRFLSPKMVSITRKRDESWQYFLDQISPDTLVALAPEGRMMRKDGLDKDGKPMSVRGGIADILRRVGSGKFMIAYSGGLHHVNRPGEKKIRLFQTLKLRLEVLDIQDYLHSFGAVPDSQLRLLIAKDLEARLSRYKP